MLAAKRNEILSAARQAAFEFGLDTKPRIDEEGRPRPSIAEEFGNRLHDLIFTIIEEADEVKGYRQANLRLEQQVGTLTTELTEEKTARTVLENAVKAQPETVTPVVGRVDGG